MMLPDCTASHCPVCKLRQWCDRPENIAASNLEMLTQKIASISKSNSNFKVV